MTKVFGIGLNKTGTTTLGVCLQTLGYRHVSCDLEMTRDVVGGHMERVYAFVDRYDSFEDWPWPLIYKELDGRYPGSRFILTTRITSDAWYESLRKHATRTGPTEYRRLVYGHDMPHEDREAHVAFYERHNSEVRRYFDGRTDFVELCWEKGDAWPELCGFLGHEVPRRRFPHANRAPSRLERFLNRLRIDAASAIGRYFG